MFTFFFKFVVIFLEILSFLCSVLCVSPETNPRHCDRSVSVPAESAAGTVTLDHVYQTHKFMTQSVTCRGSLLRTL